MGIKKSVGFYFGLYIALPKRDKWDSSNVIFGVTGLGDYWSTGECLGEFLNEDLIGSL